MIWGSRSSEIGSRGSRAVRERRAHATMEDAGGSLRSGVLVPIFVRRTVREVASRNRDPARQRCRIRNAQASTAYLHEPRKVELRIIAWATTRVEYQRVPRPQQPVLDVHAETGPTINQLASFIE